LASTIADGGGFWEIGPLRNWDEDEGGALDLYVIFKTDAKAGEGTESRIKVTDFSRKAYG
jgi:hypothetical protein